MFLYEERAVVGMVVISSRRPAEVNFSLVIVGSPTLHVALRTKGKGSTLSVLTTLRLRKRDLPSIVLVSIHVPIVSKLSTATEVGRSCPSVHVLVLAACSRSDCTFKKLDTKTSKFLLGSIGAGSLYQTVRSICSKSTVLAPQVAGRIVHQKIPGIDVGTSALTVEDGFSSLKPHRFRISTLIDRKVAGTRVTRHLKVRLRTIGGTIDESLTGLSIGRHINVTIL